MFEMLRKVWIFAAIFLLLKFVCFASKDV